MTLRSNFSSTRSASIVLAFVLLRHGALAQGYNSTEDPFGRTNAGEQLMPQTDRRFEYTPDRDGPTPTLFLPLLPPVLGAKSASTWTANFASGFAPNIDRETFYAAYTFEASRGQLRTNENKRVAAYIEKHRQLVDEIQAKFQELASVGPAARATGLAQFATEQDGRLRALADEEESIRLALIGWRHDFDHARLGQRVFIFGGPTRAAVRLLFATSYYAGLSTEQRRLLPEIAYEQATPVQTEGAEWSPGSTFFFLPATARIQPPANLPPALDQKIRTFVRDKDRLKTELRGAILQSSSIFISNRTRRLGALAEQQAPRFATLEKLAEEIRTELTGLGFPDQTASLALPVDLTERVGKFYARKVETRRELLNRLRELRSEYPTGRFEIAQQGDGLAIVQSKAGDKAAASVAEFNAGQARRYSEFAHESEILRHDIQLYLLNNPQRATRTVDQLAADFAKAYAARESGETDRDYVRAVLQPGLSPPQRRLLFQAATAELAQASEPLQP